MANSVDPDQTAPIGTVCSGSTLFASILNLSGMLGNYLQQTTSADNIFRCIFFLALLRISMVRVKLDPFFQNGNQRDDDRTDWVGVADAKSLLQHSHIFFKAYFLTIYVIFEN